VGFAADIALITQVVRGRDPAFAHADPVALDRALAALPEAQERDAFLLAAMRVMALGDNAHSRVIPNGAVHVLPLRLVALGRGVCVTQGGPVGGMLVSVNGVRVETLLARAAPLLAGPPARQRVIGALLLAWPAALSALGAGVEDVTHYVVEGGTAIDLNHAGLVAAETLYPAREKGGRAPEGNLTAGFVTVEEPAPGLRHLRLRDLHDPSGTALPAEVAAAVAKVAVHDGPLIIDLRGNPGGNFMQALLLVEAICARPRAAVLLLDLFTFSAAIVTAAILKARLGDALRLVGELPGDRLRFWAEGDNTRLPDSGAVLRHSDAWHDWESGRPDATTPPEIAALMVGAGPLRIDRPALTMARDLAEGRDPALETALSMLGVACHHR
jgi:hypothetical protein